MCICRQRSINYINSYNKWQVRYTSRSFYQGKRSTLQGKLQNAERNGTGSNWCIIHGRGRRYCDENCASALINVWNILAVYLVSLSGIADPSLTSEVSAMSVPCIWGVELSVAHPETGREWYRVLYSPQTRNKHHQSLGASAGISTPGELDSYWLSMEIYSTGISVARFTIS